MINIFDYCESMCQNLNYHVKQCISQIVTIFMIFKKTFFWKEIFFFFLQVDIWGLFQSLQSSSPSLVCSGRFTGILSKKNSCPHPWPWAVLFWQDKNILSGRSGGLAGEAEGWEATGSRGKDPELDERLDPAETIPAATLGNFDSAEIHPGSSGPQVTDYLETFCVFHLRQAESSFSTKIPENQEPGWVQLMLFSWKS